MSDHNQDEGEPARPGGFLYVSNAVVKAVLSPADAVRVAEETLRDQYDGAVSFASSRQLDMPAPGQSTVYKAKGCVLSRLSVAGFRILSLNRTPEGYALAGRRPTKHILLSDTRTGEFFAIVDEHWSHALRTGACAAAAAKYLMNPSADVLALLGAGYMAYGALVAMTAVMRPREVRVWSRTPATAAAFATRMSGELGLNVVAVASPQAAVRDAPAVITATSAPKPYLRHEWFAQGVFLYALGNYQEVDLETYRRMTLIADERGQVMICPDIVQFKADGVFDPAWFKTDLGDVVARPEARRRDAAEQIMVRSQGLVTQDVAQAAWIDREARARGLGFSLEPAISHAPQAGLF